ncbi:MAG: polyphenol oxidase family protein [Actinomycetota bacterium]
MFAFHDSRGPVEVAFTDRHDGVSTGPYSSLNLGVPPTGDGDPESHRVAAEENLDLAAYALARGGEAWTEHPYSLPSGVRPPVTVTVRQIHGADVHTVDRAWLDAPHAEPAVADGLVTAETGVILVVRVADCVPVLLADVQRRLVGAAHAGRAGLVAGVVPATVARLRELGAENLVAWVGPHVCGRCYEVPAALRDEVATAVPEAFAETSWGTPSLDVGAGVTAQLRAEGAEVVDGSRCTLEDEDLFSYRRQGAASGRLGGLVWVRP